MSVKIQVTPELLREKSGELRTLKSNHDENMAKMRSLIMNLNEIFEGKAHASLIQEYESMQSTFTNFSNMIENYAKWLDTAANRFEEQDASDTTTYQNNIQDFG